eukprot:TRINITY_DN13021_c0_g1_i1.p1 TRINITY_DN13021_c0_g1~~TRINITY_DN13021_c0_g1_i1.p1  ORF type:complete len:202 (+),score=35.50 TRINITY_DN13021_c0_g1_i1:47-652(+)
MASRRKILLKIIVLGESGVGKTSLLVRYVDNKFNINTKSTIGADFLSKPIEVDDQPVTLQIWDTAGQERFQGLGTTFYRGSDGAIFVFDVSRKATFDALLQWKNAFLIQVGQEGNDNFPMIVVANKVDRDDRVITSQMVQKFCKENNLDYVECSAKDATNVPKAFERITRKIISQMKPEDIQYDTVKLDLGGKEKEDPCAC